MALGLSARAHIGLLKHLRDVAMESKGEYTKFIIQLPVVRYVNLIVTHERKVLNKPAGNMTILIVDDEYTCVKTNHIELHGEGYFVESTNNGLKGRRNSEKGG